MQLITTKIFLPRVAPLLLPSIWFAIKKVSTSRDKLLNFHPLKKIDTDNSRRSMGVKDQ